MDYIQMTAPCGLDCFNCAMYFASNDEGLRTYMSQHLGVPIEQASCNGCRNEGGKIAFLGMTEPCNVYQCTGKQGIKFCCECNDFPCDHLHPYADKASQTPHNTKVFNLCLIKKLGLESWAKDKSKYIRERYFKKPWKL